MFEFNFPIPDLFTCDSIDAECPEGSEVCDDVVPGEHRSGGGVADELVNGVRLFDVGQLDLQLNAPGLVVYLEQGKFNTTSHLLLLELLLLLAGFGQQFDTLLFVGENFNGGGHPETPSVVDRRRPPATGEIRFPCQI